jgi:hypothetical protein
VAQTLVSAGPTLLSGVFAARECPRHVHRLLSIAAAVLMLAGVVSAQTVDFEMRTFPESPVVFVDAAPALASSAPWRQFITVKNASRKSVAAVLFEQRMTSGSKSEIVALERVSIVFAAGEKRRVTIAVGDVVEKLQGDSAERPVLSIVAVEYLDGTQWNAPTGSH